MLLRRLAFLERRTLRAAQRFSDYNFRSYFVAHTKDTFAAARSKLQAAAPGTTASPDAAAAAAAAKVERKLVLRQLVKDLRRMRRMSLINRMYAKQKVVVDPRRAVPE